MNNREVASLACKILGMYIIIQAINVLFTFFYVSVTTSFQDNILNLSFAIGYILFGILLWYFSDKLSVIMVKTKNCDKESLSLDINSIQRVAFSVLGLFFIGNSLPKLVGLLCNIYLSMIDHNLSSILILRSGGIIAEFIIGLVIFLGSKGLVNFLNKMRNFGLEIEDKDR
ncbi:MAG: hypothetical protein AAGU27_27290 [Dehalobacterium sp.]